MKRALEQKRHMRRGLRFGTAFMQRPPRSVWSFAELYGRSTRWASTFKSRRAAESIEAGYRRLQNELLDCMSLNTTPLMSALIERKDK